MLKYKSKNFQDTKYLEDLQIHTAYNWKLG